MKRLFCIFMVAAITLTFAGFTGSRQTQDNWETVRTDNQTQAADSQAVKTKAQTAIPAGPILATVHTYSTETYQIEGEVQKYTPRSERGEASLEIKGTLETFDEQRTATVTETDFSDAEPLSITVYTPSGEIYGFYTAHAVKTNEQKGNMDIYGYAVGYFDGESHFS